MTIEEQQEELALHRMREQLIKFRMAQIDCLRGLLAYELRYGRSYGYQPACKWGDWFCCQ